MSSFDNPVLVQYRLNLESGFHPSVMAHMMLREYFDDPSKGPWRFANTEEIWQARWVLYRISHFGAKK